MGRRIVRQVVMVALLAAVLVAVGAGSAAAHTVARGISESHLDFSDEDAVDRYIADVRTNLRATWVRFDVAWSRGETAQGSYEEEYLSQVAAACAKAKAAGMKVIVTVTKVPRWASQSDLWNTPVPGYAKGYRDFYLPKLSSMDEFRDFMDHVATTFGTDVAAYECWNEPNLWMFLAPQKRGNDNKYAARRYRTMLKYFRAGVRAGNPTATVVGGAFGPYGPNDKWRTSPQRFARDLKYLGGARYMDAVSHHPYQAGTSSTFKPSAMPRWPTKAVSLRNLNVIMKLFPGKPVYLTEYGYNTKYCTGIGPGVGAVRQAAYLRQAYAYARRYSRVKVMVWYLLRDEPQEGAWTTGLRTATGTKKPSYYVFSNKVWITLNASRTKIRRGARVKLTGVVRWRPIGGPTERLSNKKLVLERKVGRQGWRRVRTLRTNDDGVFVTRVSPGRTARFRVRWQGVKGSPSRLIRVR